MDPLIIGSLISGGLSLGSSLFNGYSQKSAVKEANKGNMELAKYQNARNIELWNANNEYNSPGAQMGRLQEAGLNPNLVYGSGSAVGNTSAAPPSTAVPTMQPAPFLLDNAAWTGLSQIADTALKAANIEKTKQETENLAVYQEGVRRDNALKDLDIIAKQYANAKSKEEADIWREMLNAKLQLLTANDVLTHASARNIDSTRIFRDTQGYKESNQKLNLMESQRRLNNANRDLSISNQILNTFRQGLLTAQIKDSLSHVGVNEQTALEIAQKISNLKTDQNYTRSRVYGQSLENQIKKILIERGVDIRDGGLIRGIVRSLNHSQVSYAIDHDW